MILQDLLKDWEITKAATCLDNLELDSLSMRYGNTFRNWMDIVGSLKSVTRSDNRRWLFTPFDYAAKSRSAFEWNFIEKQEIEAAFGYSDLQEETLQFWNRILPIGLSVDDGYRYYGLTDGGLYVTGIEPDYHDYTVLGDDLNSITTEIIRIG